MKEEKENLLYDFIQAIAENFSIEGYSFSICGLIDSENKEINQSDVNKKKICENII